MVLEKKNENKDNWPVEKKFRPINTFTDALTFTSIEDGSNNYSVGILARKSVRKRAK